MFIEFEQEELVNRVLNARDYQYIREQNAKDVLPMKKIELQAELKYINKLILWTKILNEL